MTIRRIRRTRLVQATFVLVGILSFVSGSYGLHQYLVTQSADSRVSNILAGVKSLFLGGGFFSSGDIPAALAFAQVAAPIVTAFATFELFRSRAERAFRLTRCRRRKDHVVLVGLGRNSRLIAEQLDRIEEPCVVGIDVDPDESCLDLFDRPRWAVVKGDAIDPRTLRRAGVLNASLIHIATGQDGVDLEVAATLRGLWPERHRNSDLEVKVQIDSPTLARRLQQDELNQEQTPHIRIEFVNMTALTAASILEFVTTELTGESEMIGDDFLMDEFECVGNTHLINELASVCQRSHRARLMLGLSPLSVCEPVGIFEHELALGARIDEFGGRGRICVVHLADSSKSIEVASRLAQRHRNDLVVVLSPSGGRPVRFPARPDVGRMVFVDPDYLVQSPELLKHGPIELMARLIHSDYLRALQSSSGVPTGASTLPWADLPETFREANRAQALDFGRKLRKVGCELSDVRLDQTHLTDDEIELLATLEHDRWVQERREKGWVHGSSRDDVARVHPDLCAYDDLSEEAQEKDRQTVRRLFALAASIGLVVVRSA